MQVTLQMLGIVCPLAMLAGFVDSVAGGGGLISLPAYYLAGLPPTMAAGTNKLSATMGTLLAAYNYGRSGKINRDVAIPSALGALVCAALGVLVMKSLPENVVRMIVMSCIPVAAVFTLRGGGKAAERNLPRGRTIALALLIGCAIGFYDGLVGPGTGTFLILLFNAAFGMDSVTASGTAKITNLVGNLAAFFSLLLAGDVLWLLGLPCGLCAMLGNQLGSRMTILKGGRFVRVMMLCVLFLLLAKMITDVLQ